MPYTTETLNGSVWKSAHVARLAGACSVANYWLVTVWTGPDRTRPGYIWDRNLVLWKSISGRSYVCRLLFLLLLWFQLYYCQCRVWQWEVCNTLPILTNWIVNWSLVEKKYELINTLYIVWPRPRNNSRSTRIRRKRQVCLYWFKKIILTLVTATSALWRPS